MPNNCIANADALALGAQKSYGFLEYRLDDVSGVSFRIRSGGARYYTIRYAEADKEPQAYHNINNWPVPWQCAELSVGHTRCQREVPHSPSFMNQDGDFSVSLPDILMDSARYTLLLQLELETGGDQLCAYILDVSAK